MPTKLDTERDWYNLLATQSKESVALKSKLDNNYANLRSWLLEIGGFKPYVASCAEYSLQGGIDEGFSGTLNEVDPRALMVIAKYATEYRGPSHNFLVEPKPGGCYGNSWVNMKICNETKVEDTPRLNYIEGIAFNSGGCHAVLHAWNSYDRFPDIAFDWTWYALAGWSFYFGIALSEPEYDLIQKLAYPGGRFHLLFSRESFPRIEAKLTEILEQRQRVA